MAFMNNASEQDVPKGRNFSACSAAGQAGWSPLMPNKFAASVLKPLMEAQGASGGFADVWTKFLPDTPMPSLIKFAHGAALSVARDQILAHPKDFYQRLLEVVSGNKMPYQTYLFEYMLWYIFNPTGSSLCPNDHASTAAATPTPSRRNLQAVPSVLEPRQGSRLRFGDMIPISFVRDAGIGGGPVQIELYRFGNFETVLATYFTGTSWNWPLHPGPASATAKAGFPTQGKPWTANKDTPLYADAYWNKHYLLTPNDKYTIRVCPILLRDVGTSQGPVNPVQGYCTSAGFGESGEFDILASLSIAQPASSYVHQLNNVQLTVDPYEKQSFLPVQWTSYYTNNAAMSMALIDARSGYTVARVNANSQGYYNWKLSPDTPAGQYVIEISASCESCNNQFMGSAKQSGALVTGRSGIFTIVAATSPPPSPNPPPAASPPPNAPFELPIIKAFRDNFGQNQIYQGAFSTSSTVSGTSQVQNTESGRYNCAYVCQVGTSYGVGRRLLFGGLQYSSGTAQPVTGCTPAQVACGCCNGR